ncbi:MAG: ribose-phosphate pyrophosphokinase [Kiritimatiellia bacterium]|jgi:ribose-phosphate pyrophosphokinase|nr:ribose-phosphate pyrophosphokinase [Kiritimatiellia bacterium]MDP6629711.1 ribose-phosphate pyrophosphokinase [Kiritimatiellia bacterium]MDP6810950.1 ribose-phosphate pyrophosphokinase [Kiritimatiellia bacterium]MDP7023255.1 ribose-phosphate pyrophosphokinase [Kiritimatiellia bacterium]
MKIFSGTSNPVLAEKIAEYLSLPLGEAEICRFPDEEVFVKIKENIRGRDVYIVQSICRPPNENLMELLIMIDAMRRASADRITAVLPYYGYARQDRKDQPRVPITAKLVANLLVAAGCNRLLTVDLHAQQIQGFFDIPVDHLYASPIIVKHLKSKNIENPVVVSPDTGAVKAAYAYSQMLDCGLAVAAKRRMGPKEVEAFTLVGDVEGRTAIMVDDMTSTCGTLCSAANLLAEHGAKEVYAAVTHAMLTDEGCQRLVESPISELIVTDTIPSSIGDGFPVAVLSVAELLGEAILRIHEDQSVTSLFRL